MSPNANEHEADVFNTSNSATQLPTNVLRHCLSFLGPSDNYYFLASVSKNFKTAVEQLYGENRNTSAESIIATVSTCNHVFDLIMGDTELKQEEKAVLTCKIFAAAFKNDRVDIFEWSITPLYEAKGIMNNCVTFAITNKSTEIMRLLIKDLEYVQFLKEFELENDIPLVSCVPAACDVCMIKELIDHGVKFNGESLVFALQRDDLETFEYLLNVVNVYTEEKDKLLFSRPCHIERVLMPFKC